jgi:hypothetical protein
VRNHIENVAVNRIETNCIVNFAENAIDCLAHRSGDSVESPPPYLSITPKTGQVGVGILWECDEGEKEVGYQMSEVGYRKSEIGYPSFLCLYPNLYLNLRRDEGKD